MPRSSPTQLSTGSSMAGNHARAARRRGGDVERRQAHVGDSSSPRKISWVGEPFCDCTSVANPPVDADAPPVRDNDTPATPAIPNAGRAFPRRLRYGGPTMSHAKQASKRVRQGKRSMSQCSATSIKPMFGKQQFHDNINRYSACGAWERLVAFQDFVTLGDFAPLLRYVQINQPYSLVCNPRGGAVAIVGSPTTRFGTFHHREKRRRHGGCSRTSKKFVATKV
jgi:hypothetical protein